MDSSGKKMILSPEETVNARSAREAWFKREKEKMMSLTPVTPKTGRASSSKGWQEKAVSCTELDGSPKSNALSGVYFGVVCLFKAMGSYSEAGPHSAKKNDLIDSISGKLNELVRILGELAEDDKKEEVASPAEAGGDEDGQNI